jgi:hypothetical protein
MIIDAAKFTPEQIKKRAFLRIAHILFEHWEEGTGPHSRQSDILLNHIDKNEFIEGESVAVSPDDPGGPEHVVPCAFILQQCLKFFDKGKSEGKSEVEVMKGVAEYIERYLKIVLVTKEERRKLDSKQLGLKDKMPRDWKDGDDIMVHLNVAGVRIKPRHNTNG